MRIAQVSPLYEAVPPQRYGGTERIVSYLTEELVRLRHNVTLFASGDSKTKARLIPCSSKALRLDADCRDDRTKVLKKGGTFAVFDRYGDIHPIGLGEQGIYHEGTRFLSRLSLRFGRKQPLLLSSAVNKDDILLTVDMTNTDFKDHGSVVIPRGSVHLFRSKYLLNGLCSEQLRITNYGRVPVRLPLSILYEADFADIFEVRGVRRKERGEKQPVDLKDCEAAITYRGLDGAVRKTLIRASPAPRSWTATEMLFDLDLQPSEHITLFLMFSFQVGESPREAPQHSHEAGYFASIEDCQAHRRTCCDIRTSNQNFNDWLDRSRSDLRMMVTQTPHGPYPYAGIPWYCTPFGRDGIITALEMLWIEPEIACGVLKYLSATQAKSFSSAQDAEPDKILHERRKGEMPALGEVPFGNYYGSIDATPLYVLLAGHYLRRTNDLPFLRSIWDNIEAALNWIDLYGDRDKDGFVEYERKAESGLFNQGWKDSHDSVFDAEGDLAEPPIALCEVQAYVYEAKLSAAAIAEALGHRHKAVELREQAYLLKERFEEAFWCEEIGTYALALDGRKNPCRVRSSNAGHCLFSGIASQEHAHRTASMLVDESFFSGWGIRTLPVEAARYNPMSYHNGSIWPHDNAMIAYGFSRYHFQDKVSKILTSVFEASLSFESYRLPELYCGFQRHTGQGPTHYPVACSPQTWASGSAYLFLQACLGVWIDAREGKIIFRHSMLPSCLNFVRIIGLKVGDASLDLEIHKHPRSGSVNILRRHGDVEIVTIK